MCRQLTIIAESLPVRETITVDVEGDSSRAQHEHTDRGDANLTKERNPVSDKKCQLTEQAGKERRKGRIEQKAIRENKEELRCKQGGKKRSDENIKGELLKGKA